MILYCVKCRTKRHADNVAQITMKNGKPAIKATCSKCGTGMYKIGMAPETSPTQDMAALYGPIMQAARLKSFLSYKLNS